MGLVELHIAVFAIVALLYYVLKQGNDGKKTN